MILVGILEVAAVGLQRVGGGATLGAHHLEKGLDARRTSHCVVAGGGFSRSAGMRTVISPFLGST